MARHDLTLPMWDECRRCERQRTRLGVLAPAWPAGVRIVVLGLAASRAAQGVGIPNPALLRGAETLRETLGLAPHECVADVLAACGLGDVDSDHAAACSARAVGQRHMPQVVVARDRETVEVATTAGLVDGGMWSPLGIKPIPLVYDDDFDKLVAQVAHHLGKVVPPTTKSSRAKLKRQAVRLLRALGEHTGTGRLRGRDWVRFKARPLRVADIEAHLAGEIVVAPFRPRGPWPFVVIDVDRHDALQEKNFIDTCKRVKKLFPHALEFQSSQSAGRHFYVKLPPEVSYERGALNVRAYLSLKKTRWLEDKGLRAEGAEVPTHPVRLPFGPGSFIVGSKLPLDGQLNKLVSFIQRAKSDDYDAAEHAVRAFLKMRGAWSIQKREKVQRFLEQEEVQDVVAQPLEDGDPWRPILLHLRPALQKVASSGAPAYGTRTRWTTELVTALTDLVDLDQARVLLTYWLQHRGHNSESLIVEPDLVAEQTERLLKDKYKRAGVPVRFWLQAQNSLDAFFKSRRDNDMFWSEYQERLGHPEKVSSVARRTAFYILKKFYDRGVRTRRIGWREFASFVGKDKAHVVEKLLAEGTWLVFTGPYERQEHSRIYTLGPSMWPARPGEPKVFTPG